MIRDFRRSRGADKIAHRMSEGLRMFLWKGRQAVFVLVMLVICITALVHPLWRQWYEMIMPPLLIILMILALDYAMRK